ncbi:hypothetical protein GGD67_002784 [Bradyrhizobium sp. IAR9]|nr:hypothetical protein [Bradyrhizobium sp. IAR9]
MRTEILPTKAGSIAEKFTRGSLHEQNRRGPSIAMMQRNAQTRLTSIGGAITCGSSEPPSGIRIPTVSGYWPVSYPWSVRCDREDPIIVDGLSPPYPDELLVCNQSPLPQADILSGARSMGRLRWQLFNRRLTTRLGSPVLVQHSTAGCSTKRTFKVGQITWPGTHTLCWLQGFPPNERNASNRSCRDRTVQTAISRD